MDSEDEKKQVAAAVLALAKNPVAAKTKALKAREFVLQKQAQTMAVVKKQLPV